MPELTLEREAERQDAPEEDAPEAPKFCAGFAGRICAMEADSPAGQEWIAQQFATYRISSVSPPQASLHVEMHHSQGIGLRMKHQGQACEFSEVLANPEWKCLIAAPHPSRRLYANTVLGEEPALEAVPGGVIVLNRAHVGLYAHMLWLWLLQRDRTLFNLHAAVVGQEGTALVLTGGSGAGKSTLSWALHQSGADFFGDETALFTRPELHLFPLVRDLCMRPGGVEALGASAEQMAWYRFKPTDPKCQVALPRPQRPCPHDQVIFIFMDGFAEQPSLEPIGSGDAVRRLLQGMSYGDPSVFARLEVAADLVNRYPCWRLKVGRPEATAALLAAYVRNQG